MQTVKEPAVDTETGIQDPSLALLSSNIGISEPCGSRLNSTDQEADSSWFLDLQPSIIGTESGAESCFFDRVGNFPSPRELASLDENVLAKRCNIGYRAGRILNLARNVVEGRIKLQQIEDACSGTRLSNYSELVARLSDIRGFGPFTVANVLMCLGFYHVVPTDSETIRHLKQVHGRSSSVKTIQRDVELVYEKYAPFQFLAYWSEVWHFYEERFGKLSEMHYSDYKLITAANMRPKNQAKKRIKMS